MKIFITGATGFIGRNLVKRLNKTDHELYCLVRVSSNVEFLKKTGINLVTGDIKDFDSLANTMNGCDWVVNLANKYSFWLPNKKEFEEINVIGTRNLLANALEAGVSKVVHISTAGIYGKPKDSPFHEESERGPVQFTEYTRTKYKGDQIAWELYEKQGLPLVMIYPGAVLGAGDNKPSGQYISDLCKGRMPATVFNNATITWVHVNDVADAIIKALEKDNNIGEKYLIGNQPLTFRELNELISNASGRSLPFLKLPDNLVYFTARILTIFADIFKKAPMLGLSVDQTRMMGEGFIFDGSKAIRELGITYTPIQTAIEELIASID